HIVGVTRDITERKRMEERIAKLNQLKQHLLGSGGVDQKLKLITDGVVGIFGADFARNWMTKEGDLCEHGCIHAAAKEGPGVCRNRARCLHLVASSGRYTHLDGDHRRVPLGCYKIGRVASGEDAYFITNDVVNDPRVHNHEWARSLGLVSFAGYRLVSPEGQPMGVLAFFRQRAIAPREQNLLEDLANTASQVLLEGAAREALLSSEERFRRIFEDGPLGMATTATDFRFTRANRAFCSMMGYSEQELTALTFKDITHPEHLSADAESVNKLARGEITDYRTDKRYLRKDGGMLWASVTISAIRDYKGRLLYFLPMVQDITERKQAEDNLKAASAELERSNKELEMFAYVASHDLQEPLRLVSAYTQLLMQRYRAKLDAGADPIVGFITEGVSRMQRLIQDLLAYSRVNTRPKAFGRADCEKVLAQALTNLSVTIHEQQAVVTHDPLPAIKGDEVQLGQLFQNLIGNAIKFRRQEPPSVHLSAQKTDDGSAWLFSVRDNGIGIEAEFYERIFIIFQRLHNRTKYSGTGIGLAICKRIVERHGGRIWVESKKDQGSAFFFTIPCNPTKL
ncbi:MAG: PAS domain S-box protein, partial [Verrucomicrobia bacterium]|nr:PAS domain S-box protein [Verrucomicrobiota bacterium]